MEKKIYYVYFSIKDMFMTVCVIAAYVPYVAVLCRMIFTEDINTGAIYVYERTCTKYFFFGSSY